LIVPLKEEFTKACHFKNIAFELNYNDVSEDFLIEADKDLLGKVLHHLLDNAVKFTSEGSVSLSLVRKAGFLEFHVTDTGVGIDKKFQDQVFIHFEQEDSTNLRQFDGSGLGLAISKKICDLIGAEISFESKKAKGTSFKVLLPLKGADNYLSVEKMNEQDMKIDEMQKPLILVAEDEDSNYTVLKMLIEKKMNAEVIRAKNGLEAVENVRNNAGIKLVLMDLKMPVMDGLEATGIIKSERNDLPVVAITAYGLSGDEHKALSAGCDDYLSKPIQTYALFEKIRKFLETA
jgi:CheY-like chemotaxis protein